VAARHVNDDLDEPRIAADGVVDDEPGRPAPRIEKARNVFYGMRATTDQKGHHDHVGESGGCRKRIQKWIVVDERRKHLTRNPPMAERVGDPERGAPALRMPSGSVPHERQRRRPALDSMIAHELGHPARYERADPGMRSHRRCLAQTDLAVPAVPREGFRQNPLSVVPRAREKRHHRYLVRVELVQHGLESGLTLVKRHRNFVVEAPLPQRLRDPPNQRVGLRVTAGAMRGED
jgi:hypothetical protein